MSGQDADSGRDRTDSDSRTAYGVFADPESVVEDRPSSPAFLQSTADRPTSPLPRRVPSGLTVAAAAEVAVRLDRSDSLVPASDSWTRFYLDYEGLNQRLINVKREFGLRRTVSLKSMTGETHTFSEILDLEAEKIVLFYLRVQGDLARRVWELREQHFQTSILPTGTGTGAAGSLLSLAERDSALSLSQVNGLCERYRALGQEVLDLLEYLDHNVIALRSIVKKHDKHFKSKMSSLYFDSRLSSGKGNSTALVQLYHQEGLRAIIATIRRGFSELYEARISILASGREREHALRGFRGGSRTRLSSSGTGGSYDQNDPEPSFMSRLVTSISNFNLLELEQEGRGIFPPRNNHHHHHLHNHNHNHPRARGASDEGEALGGAAGMRGGYGALPSGSPSPSSLLMAPSPSGRTPPAVRNLDELEPVLFKIAEASERVLRSQKKTTSEYLATHSEMALYNARDDESDSDDDQSQQTEEDEEGGGGYFRVKEGEDYDDATGGGLRSVHGIRLAAGAELGPDGQPPRTPGLSHHRRDATDSGNLKRHLRTTSSMGLFINLLVTFLYMANQYVVAPTSGAYSEALGESKFMSGVIIGLSPLAALLSALVYSHWTNYSFKEPLICAISFAVVGNLLYGMALQYNSEEMIFLGRLLSGLGAPRGIARRYIADHVSLQHRTMASSHFVTAGALGLALGPFISSAVTAWTTAFTVELWGVTLVRFESVTAPGWIMFVAWLFALIMVLLGFREPMPAVGVVSTMKSIARSLSTATLATLNFDNDQGQGGSAHMGERAHRFSLPFSSSSHLAAPGSTKTAVPFALTIDDGAAQAADKATGAGAVAVDSGSSAERNPGSSIFTSMAASVLSLVGADGRQGQYTEITDSGGNEIVSKVVSVEVEMGGSGRPSAPKSALPQLLQQQQQQSALSPPRDRTGTPQGPLSPVPLEKVSSFKNRGSNPMAPYLRTLHENSRSAFSCLKYMTVEIHVILFIYLVNKTGQEIVVSSVPTLTSEIFSWSSESAGFFMAFMGALVLPANILLSKLAQSSEDRALVPFLSILSLCSIVFLIDTKVLPYSSLQYVLGASSLFALLNALEGVIMSLLSKVVPAELAKGTFNSGLLATEAGTLGRVIGDCMLTYLAERQSASTSPSSTLPNDGGGGEAILNALFLPIAIGVLVSILLVYRFYEQLKC